VTENNRLKRTLEYDLGDAPMIMAALRLAAATAMMCGHPQAEKKLRIYQKMVAAHIPPEATGFDEEAWAEMSMALTIAASFRVTIERRFPQDYWGDGYLAIHVGGRRYLGDRGVSSQVKIGDTKQPEALYQALLELAPMDCEGTWDSGKERA
jgi:hypothetical protein